MFAISLLEKGRVVAANSFATNRNDIPEMSFQVRYPKDLVDHSLTIEFVAECLHFSPQWRLFAVGFNFACAAGVIGIFFRWHHCKASINIFSTSKKI